MLDRFRAVNGGRVSALPARPERENPDYSVSEFCHISQWRCNPTKAEPCRNPLFTINLPATQTWLTFSRPAAYTRCDTTS